MKNLIIKTVAVALATLIFTGCNAGHRLQELGGSMADAGTVGFVLGAPVYLTGVALNGGQNKVEEAVGDKGELWENIHWKLKHHGDIKKLLPSEWEYYRDLDLGIYATEKERLEAEELVYKERAEAEKLKKEQEAKEAANKKDCFFCF